MKTTKTKIFLYSIFLITVIPIIYVYIEHASVEANAHQNTNSETKKIKTLSEAILFGGIGIGYMMCTAFIFLHPKSPIPYLVIIVGTIAVVILYYFRIYGLMIPGTEIVIVDFSTDWRDIVTKVCQQILGTVTGMLFILNTFRNSNNTGTTRTT